MEVDGNSTIRFIVSKQKIYERTWDQINFAESDNFSKFGTDFLIGEIPIYFYNFRKNVGIENLILFAKLSRIMRNQYSPPY
jgi:hypothetical protein